MRICQVGCGAHAGVAYAPALAACTTTFSLTLAACCDLDAAQAQEYAVAAGFARTYSDYRAMVDAEQPDAVLVTTPYQVTPEIASFMMERGIPVLLEKPPGDSYQQALELTATARRTGALHQIAYNRRHMPLVVALVEALDGLQVRHIDYRMHRVNRGENHFHTTAVHGFDLVSRLAGGGLTEARALYRPLTPGAVEAHFLCRYEGGATASISLLPMSDVIMDRVEVSADGGYAIADLPVWGARAGGGSLEAFVGNASTLRLRDADLPDGTQMYETNGFVRQLETFLTCVAAGRAPADSLDTALDASMLSELMKQRATDYVRH